MADPIRAEVLADAIADRFGMNLSWIRERDTSTSVSGVREVVALVLSIAGFTIREIAEVLEREPSTVRRMVRLAKRSPYWGPWAEKWEVADA